MKKLTIRQEALVARGLEVESESKQRTPHSPRKSNKHLTGCIPLALLPEEEGGQGMTPSSIPNFYKNKAGDLCNSVGIVYNEMPDCLVCLDVHFVKIDPREIRRESQGAWHSLRVPCPKYDQETRACAP